MHVTALVGKGLLTVKGQKFAGQQTEVVYASVTW